MEKDFPAIYMDDSYVEDVVEISKPEHILLINVLERASRDLDPSVENIVRIQARKWFEDYFLDPGPDDEFEDTRKFTFRNIVSLKLISKKDLEWLKEKIEMSKAFDTAMRAHDITLAYNIKIEFTLKYAAYKLRSH